MKKIDFKKRVEELEIAGKVYEIEVSNYDFIKKSEVFVVELEESRQKLMNGGNVDDMLSCLKQMIDFVLGDYDRIWEEAGHNIHNMLDVAMAINDTLQTGLQYKIGKYL